jgi:hypothetical protein
VLLVGERAASLHLKSIDITALGASFELLLAIRRSSCGAGLFGDYAIGPLHQGNKDGWVTELGIPCDEIRFRNPTGSGAGPSRKDRNVFGDDLFAQFTERRPTDGKHGIGGGLAH